MADNFERFIRWYLRFNGYFTVENFYVHNPYAVSEGYVGAATETDLLGVRLPFSAEGAGPLTVANHPQLVSGAVGRFDIVIAEVKNSNRPKPNRVWRHHETRQPDNLQVIEYILRFVGLWPEQELHALAEALATNYRYEDARCRIRYIIFSRSASKQYLSRGLQFITFTEIIAFLDEQRCQSWLECGLGVASIHDQWEPLVNSAFEILNSNNPAEQRRRQVLDLLSAS